MTSEIIKKHYRKIAKKGGDTTKQRYGVDHFRKIQAKSVESRLKNKAKSYPQDIVDK